MVAISLAPGGGRTVDQNQDIGSNLCDPAPPPPSPRFSATDTSFSSGQSAKGSNNITEAAE